MKMCFFYLRLTFKNATTKRKKIIDNVMMIFIKKSRKEKLRKMVMWKFNQMWRVRKRNFVHHVDDIRKGKE